MEFLFYARQWLILLFNSLLYRQARFVLPGTTGSPPKVLTMDEVQNAIKNVENMTLAHEIAINPDFRLEPYNPPENSLEKKIKTILHEAFWDLLRAQLNSDPPCYDHAIVLLGDIKEVAQSTNKLTSILSCSVVILLFPGIHAHHFQEQSKSIRSHLRSTGPRSHSATSRTRCTRL